MSKYAISNENSQNVPEARPLTKEASAVFLHIVRPVSYKAAENLKVVAKTMAADFFAAQAVNQSVVIATDKSNQNVQVDQDNVSPNLTAQQLAQELVQKAYRDAPDMEPSNG